jgi:hypothetical protein
MKEMKPERNLMCSRKTWSTSKNKWIKIKKKRYPDKQRSLRNSRLTLGTNKFKKKNVEKSTH